VQVVRVIINKNHCAALVLSSMDACSLMRGGLRTKTLLLQDSVHQFSSGIVELGSYGGYVAVRALE